MPSGIYKITHVPTGRIYVGSAVDLYQRRRSHWSLLGRKVHDNIHLQRSWDKHGAQEFEFSVVELVEKEKLLQREQFYIDDLDPHFNILRQAGSQSGMKHSAESRAKMSEAQKRRFENPEERQRVSQASLGRRHSLESKARMVIISTGRKQPPEACEQRSIVHSKSYYVTSPGGDSEKITNLTKFCLQHNLNKGFMYAVANGRIPHYKNWLCSHVKEQVRHV